MLSKNYRSWFDGRKYKKKLQLFEITTCLRIGKFKEILLKLLIFNLVHELIINISFNLYFLFVGMYVNVFSSIENIHFMQYVIYIIY